MRRLHSFAVATVLLATLASPLASPAGESGRTGLYRDGINEATGLPKSTRLGEVGFNFDDPWHRNGVQLTQGKDQNLWVLYFTGSQRKSRGPELGKIVRSGLFEIHYHWRNVDPQSYNMPGLKVLLPDESLNAGSQSRDEIAARHVWITRKDGTRIAAASDITNAEELIEAEKKRLAQVATDVAQKKLPVAATQPASQPTPKSAGGAASR